MITPQDGDFNPLAGSGQPPAAVPQGIIADPNALLQAEIDRVVLEQTGRSADELRELQALEQLPPLSDEELARQAAADPGADGDPSTPE
ncbi:hypothetical protein [Ottowia sp.]|uniref:hypothetical protein n=1 Tax=Ottowia sp. TaxID=1898956 RepID=UPI002BAC33A2|nr:hypothetical protein [Ottowia sp.]HOB66204.1 hypothetical protein [Ottowia sp.]HPZ58237.1 hypothetical protein [Ottowia sp.]HQD48599.1 hypothetical protein [Ottowia sp.]